MDTKTFDFTGQVAIVTGGGRGIGRAIAQALAAAHAAVAVVARSQAEIDETASLINGSGGKALAIRADVADRSAVEAMAHRVEQELGAVDLLVNNAGIICTVGPTWESDPDEWRRVIDVNLYAPFLCARAVLPGMIERKRGRIVNVSSIAGMWPIPYGNSYATTKTALVRFAESLAEETQELGIKVFSIDPGSIRTAMLAYLIESEEAQKWRPGAHQYDVEVGVWNSLEGAAGLVMLLASGKADSLSGRFFSVEDDMAQVVAQAEKVVQDDLFALRVRRLPQPSQ
jgi:NAD(P)-dependent dehydrogenase (short-subunit alcohol dehydrogenase family)